MPIIAFDTLSAAEPEIDPDDPLAEAQLLLREMLTNEAAKRGTIEATSRLKALYLRCTESQLATMAMVERVAREVRAQHAENAQIVAALAAKGIHADVAKLAHTLRHGCATPQVSEASERKPAAAGGGSSTGGARDRAEKRGKARRRAR